MRRPATVLLAAVAAVAAGTGGFTVAHRLAPPSQLTDVSVLELPSTPTPSPTADPTPTGSSSRIRVRSSDGDVEIDGNRNGARSCPAGCSCDQHPNGIVIRCTGN